MVEFSIIIPLFQIKRDLGNQGRSRNVILAKAGAYLTPIPTPRLRRGKLSWDKHLLDFFEKTFILNIKRKVRLRNL